jgi:phospholipid-binding lipoprotein MlaA
VKVRIFIISFLLCLAGTASAQNKPNDPYEDFNRHMYLFDEVIEKVFFKPLATIYQTVLPSPVRTGVTNAFNNLGMIPTVINDGLQGNGSAAGKDTGRFLINSTAGVGGLVDVAKYANLPQHHSDFGLTMAKWGYKDSNYLVLPFFGPSTVRDALGLPVNYATTIYPYIDDTTSYALYGTNTINTRSNLLNYDNVLKQAYDPYVFVRDAYLQKRKGAIEGNQ